MKNTLPTHYHHAIDCLNMRPAECDPEALVPVGIPASLADSPLACLGHFTGAEGLITEIFYHDNELLARSYPHGETPPLPYCVTDSLTSTPTACIETSNGFLVLTDGDPVTLERDGNLLRALPQCGVNDYPAITSVTTGEVSLPFNTGTIKLSREYTALPEYPDPADAKTIISQLTGVIEHTADRATLSGVFTAPVLFRYRLLGEGGKILFTSVPRMHVPSGRHAPASPLTLHLDGKTLAPSVSSIEGFGIDVTIPAITSPLVREKVERIELQLSPQLHIPVDDFLILDQLRRGNNTSTIDLHIPRYASHPSLEQKVMKILESPEQNFVTALTIYSPFRDGTPGLITLTPRPLKIADEKIVTSKSTDPFLSLLGYHDYGATAGINDAGRLLLAAIHVMRYSGAPLPYFINTGDTLDNVEAVITVTLESGERIVNSRYIRSGREVFLSPLLAYPDPAARRMEIQLCDSAGTNRYASLPLTPVGCMACYLSPGLHPISLTHDASTPDFNIPATNGAWATYPGIILSLDNGNPLSVTSTGPGTICAIRPVANPSSSAWEASRSRFHILSSDGIFALALNAGKLQTPRLLDSRPVMRADASAILSTTVGNSHYAIAGGDLVLIGSNSVKTVRSGVSEVMLAPLPHRAELLLIPASAKPAEATVMHLSPLKGWSRRTLPSATRIYSNKTVSYLTTTDSLLNLSDELPTPVQCLYRRELEVIKSYPHGIPGRLEFLYIDLQSPSARGTFTISSSSPTTPAGGASRSSCSPVSLANGAAIVLSPSVQNQEILTVLTIDGPINAPLCHHLLLPRRHRLWLTLNLTLHPASHYHPLNP